MASHSTGATPVHATGATPVPPAKGRRVGWSWSAEPLLSHEGTIVVLRMGGEIDMLNQSELQNALTDTLNGRPRYVIVDLAAVTFCWVHGLILLGEAAATAAGNGTGYALSGLSVSLRRYVDLLWGDARPATYPTTATAVSAIRARHAD
jgi:anti-anti-sigma factor